MGGHLGRVERMSEMMHGAAPGMPMGMSDEQRGAAMGMDVEEHRRMIEEMEALRSDAEELREAPDAQVRERMSAHLDRMERLLGTMEDAGAHMRAP